MLSLRGKRRVSQRGGGVGGGGGGLELSTIGSLGRGQGCAAEAFKSLSLFKTRMSFCYPV